jgi:hypothetical protein
MITTNLKTIANGPKIPIINIPIVSRDKTIKINQRREYRFVVTPTDETNKTTISRMPNNKFDEFTAP